MGVPLRSYPPPPPRAKWQSELFQLKKKSNFLLNGKPLRKELFLKLSMEDTLTINNYARSKINSISLFLF